MVQTSGDVLNIILAVAIAVFTFFVCWLLFSLTSILRRVSSVLQHVEQLISAVQDKVARAETIFTAVEEKLKDLSSFFPLVLTGINSIVSFIKNRKRSSTSQKSRTDKNAL